jgi:hypothetical protein
MSVVVFTEQQIMDMAPDASAASSAKSLAHEAKWVNVHQHEKALWGECKGSGAKAYKTQIDLSATAFKCSCPSRKFPCKHGLGLLLLYVRDIDAFKTAEPPDWVAEWLKKREAKLTQQATKADKPVDAAAQAKRKAKRGARIEDGIEELQRWCKDLIRAGIAAAPDKEKNFWNTMSRRMIDAQAPGLALLVRKLAATDFSAENWQTDFIDQLSLIYTLTESYQRISTLPEPVQHDVRSWIGFGQSQEDLRTREATRDLWIVLGRRTEYDQNVTAQRYWFYGVNTKRFALNIQYQVAGRTPVLTFAPGTAIDAEVVFYDSAFPYRVAVRTQHAVTPVPEVVACANWNAVLEQEAAWAAQQPFQDEKPFIVHNIRPAKAGNTWMLADEQAKGMKLKGIFERTLHLLAQSGGDASTLFVVGKENEYEPIGIWKNGSYYLLDA